MPRCPRGMSPTKVYHVMIRGNEGKKLFLNDRDRNRFLDIIAAKAEELSFKLYAYCLMDNHVHLLVNEKNSSISKIMQCINVSYAIYFNRRHNRIGHLFQDRFKSEVIDTQSYLLAAVRYIHNNPVKAGIVNNPLQYNWSSYSRYIEPKPDDLVNAGFILKFFSQYMNQAIKSFVVYSCQQDEYSFLDCEKQPMSNMEEGADIIEYIKGFLLKKNLTFEHVLSQEGMVKGSIKHVLALELKNKFNLSYREIGRILRISKSTVSNLVKSS